MKLILVAACAALALAGCGNQTDNYGPNYVQPGAASLDLNYIALRDCKPVANSVAKPGSQAEGRDCRKGGEVPHR